MADAVLDNLVIKIQADTSAIEAALRNLDRGLTGLEGNVIGIGSGFADVSGSANDFFSNLNVQANVTVTRMRRAFDRIAENGRLSFASLKSVALSALNDIVSGYFGSNFAGLIRHGAGQVFNAAYSGRAGGGAVSPRVPYIVGERGPELFIPETSGRISSTALLSGSSSVTSPRPQIVININNPANEAGVRQSASQVARALRRVLEKSG